MEKRVIGVILLILLGLPLVLAGSVDDEMKKITHYAEEYETGNIDYVKLMLYMSSAREGLNEILGASSKNMGGILKQDQIQKVLGEPNEKTKWVWVEGEEQDVKLDEAVPVWRKIVFDGKKIQIRMEAFPSIFKQSKFDDENFEGETPEEGAMIYRLNFEVEFKRPQDQLDIQGKIGEIKSLAESGAEMETLAKESVNAEMIFMNYFRQGGGQCEDIMKSIFGSENQRQTQQILLNEIEFYSTDDWEVILRLEMCDDCEWNYINMDMRFEGKVNFKKLDEQKNSNSADSMKKFDNLDEAGFKSKTREIISNILISLEAGNQGSAMASVQDLRILTEAWNRKANDVGEQIEVNKPMGREVEKNNNNAVENDVSNKNNHVVENTEGSVSSNENNNIVENTEEESSSNDNSDVDNTIIGNIISGGFITGHAIDNNEQSEESRDPYFWIKQDQLQRQKANDLRKSNYISRKSFYLDDLFEGYKKQEYYFSRADFEKRLIEEFREKGEEICNNNQDDNENEQVDCDDAQCGGKMCGQGTTTVENQTVNVDYYCIYGTCQAKEKEEINDKSICGNNICESGEKTCSSSVVSCSGDNSECVETSDCGVAYCPQDCVMCPVYNAVECAGRVEFSGEDENKCPLAPICISETESCRSNEDCRQPKCGAVGCVIKEGEEIGFCKMQTLTKCEEGECSDGAKQIKECNNEEVIVKICIDGAWEKTGVECSGGETEDCHDYCMDYISTMTPSCPGDLKISGTSSNCQCNWVCNDIVNNECVMASDCGGKNDVCSNGKCETIPEKILVEPTEPLVIISGTETPPGPEIETPSEPEPGIEPTNPEPEIEEPETSSEPEPGIIEPEEPEPEQESAPEPEQEQENTEVTGNFIFGFFQSILSKITLTGYAVDGEENSEDTGGDIGDVTDDRIDRDNSGMDNERETEYPEPDNECRDKLKACGNPCPPCDYEVNSDGGDNGGNEQRDNSGDMERKDNQEKDMNEKENKERCEVDCSRPCVEKCIREVCGESMDCDIDKESKDCEGSCSSDNGCVESCMSGDENWWQAFEEEHKEEKGVFMVGGGCRTEQGRTEGYIWFGGWGESFGQLEFLKNKYYERDGDWCKQEVENLIKQRKEFEKGFNQEFAQWFFEKYLPNSAEEWEQAQNGIFEIYWKNVDNQMRLAHTMQCLGKSDISELMDVNLINIEYETEFGRLEYWEELKEVKMPELDEKVIVVSPYMKVWIFPSKDFIKYEMKESMENHELFGSPEEKMEKKNQGGLTEEQKMNVREDKGGMERIREVSERYGGSLDLVIQFKDYETNEIVFNLYAQINEKDIMKVEPMLPSEVSEKDAVVEMDFALLYDVIYVMEKDMMGTRVESPPWDKGMKPVQKIKEIGNGIKMWSKMRALRKSAIITPAQDEKTIGKMTEWIMENVMGGPGPDDKIGKGDEGEESKGEGLEGIDSGMSGKAIFVS